MRRGCGGELSEGLNGRPPMWGSLRWKEFGRVEVGRGQCCEAGMVGGDHVLLRPWAQLQCWELARESYQRALGRESDMIRNCRV